MQHSSDVSPFVDSASLESAGSRIVHEFIPPWKEQQSESVAALHSIAIAFTWPTKAVVRTGSGAARNVRVLPGEIGLGGGVPMVWLETDAPSDVLEVAAPASLRTATAEELGVAAHAGLDEIHGFRDPVLLAIGLRLRGALRGGAPASALEVDTLVRSFYGRSLVRCFGGRMPARTHRLSNARMQRVVERLAEPGAASIPELAELAHMTPFHFLRSFRRTTGLTPHRAQTHLALDRARGALAAGATVADAAATAGYENIGWFRRQMRALEGTLPRSSLAG